MTCKHTIGLICYPYEGCSIISDGEQEPVAKRLERENAEEIILFDYCPDCGKKLRIIEHVKNGKKVLAHIDS